jgi:hypothetical protein
MRRELISRRVFFHYREGRKRYIPVALEPWVFTPPQRRWCARLCAALERAAVAVFRARWKRPDLARLLPFRPDEEALLRRAYGRSFTRPETLFSRMDLAGAWTRPDWPASVRVLELNLVGIGAAYYMHAAGRAAAAWIAPELECGGIRLVPEDDVLDLIRGRLLLHARRLGLPRARIALVENRRILRGPFEFETMAEYWRRRGVDVVVADPIELRVRRGRLWARDVPVDVVYRDPTLAELLEGEKEGDDLRGMWWALRHNRVVSSLAGEVDHKAIMELLSNAQFADVLPPDVRRVLAGRIPWTRVVRDARTAGPDGRLVDLAEYVRRNRRRLVLKPDRQYGGQGVLIGPRTRARDWEQAVERALRAGGGWVAQEMVPLRRQTVSFWFGGRLRSHLRYVVTGVHATENGVAVLARFSAEPVVNITRGGGVAPVLVAARNA